MTTRTSMRAGFSLVEIMVVLTIIGLILAFAVPNVFKRLEKGKIEATKTNLIMTHDLIEEFNQDTGQYPNELQDLKKQPSNLEVPEKWDGPYGKGKAVPTDGWGKQLQYKLTPEDPEHPYELYSNRPKGKGKGEAKGKISVWDFL